MLRIGSNAVSRSGRHDAAGGRCQLTPTVNDVALYGTFAVPQ